MRRLALVSSLILLIKLITYLILLNAMGLNFIYYRYRKRILITIVRGLEICSVYYLVLYCFEYFFELYAFIILTSTLGRASDRSIEIVIVL